MQNLLPVTKLLPSLKKIDENRVELSTDDLGKLVSSFLRYASVDEEWYCSTYPDVKAAIEHGDVTSARDHYVPRGYLEGRLPHELSVDEQWYLRAYPDIETAIANKSVGSVLEHYTGKGYHEGRLAFNPKINSRWYLDTYPAAREAIAKNDYGSAIEHYINVGFFLGYEPGPPGPS